MSQSDFVLRLHNISKIYPGTIALHNVNVDVKRGEVHGIIGKNGAGKSTLVGIVAGIVTPTEGQIILNQKRFAGLSRITAKKEGISIVPQEPQIIPDFTVAENLFLGNPVCRGKLINWPELSARAEKVLKRAVINLDVRLKASDLSVSEQQLLLILKACFVEDAQIIILDEASASLSQNDQELLFKIIEERKKEGKTIIFISHRTDELLRVCDRVTVLRDGKSITTEDCSNLDKEKLSSLIVGEGFKARKTYEKRWSGREQAAEAVLSVHNLTKYGVFQNISFGLKKGEILGLAGLRGSGRTEILKGIAGIDPVDEGWVQIGNSKMRFTNPAQALKRGIAYLPEDREGEGLVTSFSVRENLVLNALRKISKGVLVNNRKERDLVRRLIPAVGIKAASPEQEVSQLSGGNRQKVVIGKVLAGEPKVFLLDEPTKGVDISAKESILKIIKEKFSQSSGIVITSPGLDDLLMVCDRILVLFKGQIIAEFFPDEFEEESLYLAVQGLRKNDGLPFSLD